LPCRLLTARRSAGNPWRLFFHHIAAARYFILVDNVAGAPPRPAKQPPENHDAEAVGRVRPTKQRTAAARGNPKLVLRKAAGGLPGNGSPPSLLGVAHEHTTGTVGGERRVDP